MGLFKRKKHKERLYFYSEKDMDTYEKMVSENIGNYKSVFHEIIPVEPHIDIIVVPPSEKRDYYTLVTMGMGVNPMPVPSNYGKINRAEIAVRLPKDWEIESKDEKWYWPIRMLKLLARMPCDGQEWLGLYHDIDFVDPFSEETELCAVLLDLYDEDFEPLTLESGDQLVIYNAIPIYRTEMEYKNNNNAEALMSKMNDEMLHGPVDIHRSKVI